MRSWLDWLFPPRDDERTLRSVSPEEFRALLAPARAPLTRPETLVLLPLRDQRVRAAIHEAKYRGSEAAFARLADALGRGLDEAGLTLASAHFVAVPLGAARRKERGYNQVEEVLKRAGLPFDSDCLKRVRDTETQVALPRARRLENMRGAFTAPRPLDPAYLYIVVDDVVTTGATMQAALDALREAGAKNLFPVALAH